MVRETRVRALTAKILNGLDCSSLNLAKNCEVCLTLTSDSRIKKLNRKYRKKNRPTDVLSFSMLEGRNYLIENPILGDVVISLDTMRRQAKEYEVNEYQELLRLLIHGLLHLLGYDHENVPLKKAQLMRKIEEKLYRKFLLEAKAIII